jgi:hypothetical protein
MPCRTVIFAGDSVFVCRPDRSSDSSLRLLISDNALEELGYLPLRFPLNSSDAVLILLEM